MALEIKTNIKLIIKAGSATPTPPIGPALGQHGVDIKNFCTKFNESTKSMEKGTPIPTVITVYKDRSFSFITKVPPVASLLKKSLVLEKGSAVPNKDKVASISRKKIKEIAEAKMPDLNVYDVEKAETMVMGTARSMGITVED